jgi:hypothetical protein
MSAILPVAAASAPLFFTKLHFWYGVFVALGIGTAAQTLWAKRLKKWWAKRQNFSWFILGRSEAPGVPGSAVLPASERLGNVETDLKEQHQDILNQGVDIKNIMGLLSDVNTKLGTALSIAANTNLKVTSNGGNTDSAPDVLQRIAKKLNVWDHEGEPPVSVANIVELHDVLSAVHTVEGEVPPHHHDVAIQSGEVAPPETS